jgi:hypothetical protein
VYKINGICQRTKAGVKIKTQKQDFKEMFIYTVATVAQYMCSKQ